MYELFGSTVDQAARTVTFRLFLPDGERAPEQYDGGGLPRIKAVSVVGTLLSPATRQWDDTKHVPMPAQDFINPADGQLKGVVYQCTVGPLPHGFYEYKYRIEFENAPPRLVTDPCARYGGEVNQNSGFVIGGHQLDIRPLPAPRLPYSQLRIYELMIDDFTANFKAPDESPLAAILHKLDDLVALGINAIEFMPWTPWTYPDQLTQDFSWGYNPVAYFGVAHKYTLDPVSDTNKLIHLRRLINACHDRGLHVIMDGVFNHADASPPDRGFPYYWLYQDPADSPYVGDFAQHAYFQDLDYANRCTLEYIRDACIYWIDEFKIDGIRFDNTLGLYNPGDRGHGIPKLLSELRGHLSDTANPNFALVLEHAWDYSSIDVVNQIGATSCWLDPYRWLSMGFLGDRPAGIPQIEPTILRMLDSSFDFGPGRTGTIYIENHDHRRFMLKAGGRSQWPLTQPYVLALFTSPGATLIYNGQEYGADNDMPEDGDGRVIPRPLDWATLQSGPGPAIHALYSKLMKLRNDHPAFTSPHFYPSQWDQNATQRNPQGFGIDRDRNLVVFHRWAQDDAGSLLERVYIVLNFSGQDQDVSFEIPDPGPWHELLSGATLNPQSGRIDTRVGSNWGALFSSNP